MKVVGIIAEYNPFHKGHLYHIKKAKELTNSQYAIVVMSGNFVQRGAPAITDKYTRAQMALENGADLVIELPLYYACHSAEYFAKGAVALLNSLQVVDSLCFGSECGDITLLQETSAFLLNPPPAYEVLLKELLQNGNSFPKARQLAISHCFSHSEVLSSPNNILGVEYCKALLESQSSITPCTIPRLGASYHDTELQIENSSASAIRTALQNSDSLNALDTLKEHLPASVYPLLEGVFRKTFPVFPNDLSALLHYKLLSEEKEGYTSYVDISEDFSRRIQNLLPEYRDFDSFCALLKTKELTYTRISRSLLHILLNIKKEYLARYLSDGTVFYLRMLGFRKDSAPLLSAIKKQASLPLLSKLADYPAVISSETGLSMLREELTASQIYNSLFLAKFGTKLPSEYEQPLVLFS